MYGNWFQLTIRSKKINNVIDNVALVPFLLILNKFHKLFKCLFDNLEQVFNTYPAGMDASQMHFWDVSYIVSETSERRLIYKSLGRLIKDVSSEMSLRSLTFSQRRLWVASETVNVGLETKGSFWLPVHKPMTPLNILPN